MSTVLSQLEDIALDDIQAAIDDVNEFKHIEPPIEFVDMKHECSANTENDDNYSIKFFADMSNTGEDVFTCKYSYDVNGDDVTLCDDLHNVVYSSYCKSIGINASTNIFAEDEDLEDELSDSADKSTDNMEDDQDDIEDFVEDDTNIEINNNINNHYIAECENCGGIFISAVTQSDQKISYITGVCPLCEKETNQYLRWVIKNIDPKNP